MIVYISGKISYNPNYMKDFYEAEILLLEKGHEVINPAKLSTIMPESSTWSDYMDICKILLKKSNAIALLPNWESSRGAKLEKLLAEKWGLQVIELGGKENE